MSSVLIEVASGDCEVRGLVYVKGDVEPAIFDFSIQWFIPVNIHVPEVLHEDLRLDWDRCDDNKWVIYL